jgi:transposase
MRSVALDLGVRETAYCEVDRGLVIARRTVTDLRGLADVLGPGSKRAKVAIESCREAWHVHDTLREWGHDVVLVDTTRTRQIGVRKHGRKTDRIDAELLARAVESGGIPLAHVLSPERRELRDSLAVRRALVETRAQYITTIRGLARSRGEKIASCAAGNFLASVAKASLKVESRAMISPLESALHGINCELAKANVRLEQLSQTEPAIERLTSAPGVGLVVACAFVSVIDDARRFANSHQVESYLGLVPRESSTGGKQKLGSITKQGNSYVRALLVQSASSILRVGDPDDPLRRWGRTLVGRRGRKIAVVAVARRLAGTLWAMWRKNAAYDPARLGESSARGLAEQAQDVATTANAMQVAAAKTRRRRRETSNGLRAAQAAAKEAAL